MLVGHSMGGMTMMALGARDPTLVRERVIGPRSSRRAPAALCSPTAVGSRPSAGTPWSGSGLAVLGPLSTRPELFGRLRRMGRDVEDFLVEQNSFASPVPRSVVRYTAEILLGTPLDVINDYLHSFDGFDKRPALLEFAMPLTLVFNGREDILTPPAHSELIVAGIPGAEHVIVRDAGHVIMLEHPDLLNQLLQLIDQTARARAERIDLSRQPAGPPRRHRRRQGAPRSAASSARPRSCCAADAEAPLVERDFHWQTLEDTQAFGCAPRRAAARR